MRIACFGDSLTEGYGLAPDEALPAVLQDRLRAEGISSTCLNFGISGDTTEDGLRRIRQVIDAKPDYVILEFGANDFFMLEPVADVLDNFRALIEELRENHLPTLLIGITVLEEFDAGYKAAFDPLFAQLSAEYDLPLYPDILASYFTDPSLKLMDDTHPNAAGVAAIVRDIFPHVMKMIANP